MDATDRSATSSTPRGADALAVSLDAGEIFRLAPTGLAVLSTSGTFLSVNATLCRLLGRTERELVNTAIGGLTRNGDTVVDVEAALHSLRNGSLRRYQVERRFVHGEGHLVWALVSLAALHDDSGEPCALVCEMHDITDRKDAEAALAAAELQFRDAFDNAPIGMALISVTGTLVKVNWALCTMLGKPATRLVATAFADLASDDDRHEASQLTERLLSNAPPGEPVQLRLLHSTGREVWVRCATSLVRDSDDVPMHVIAQLEDVTDQRRAEQALRTTVAELERSNDDLEQFAHVAAHDLKSPLTSIGGFLKIIRNQGADQLDPKLMGLVDRAIAGADRMNDLIEDLLSYAAARQVQQAIGDVDLHALVGDVVDSLQGQISDTDAVVEVDALPTIRGDATQLRQLFQNLISNALKFRRPGVQPEVRVLAETARDGSLAVRIADNGVGIPEDQRARVFEVFARLHDKSVYPGTGVGLSICERVVHRHGGEIRIEDTPGGGTTFAFTLGEPIDDVAAGTT